MSDVSPNGLDWRQVTDRLRSFVARRIASAADAEDVVQAVLLRLQRSLTELRDGDRLGPWVMRSAHHAVVDYYRARGRRLDDADAALDEVPAPEDDGLASMEAAVAGYLMLLVSRLPLKYREALTLTELEGLTQAEAAELLGLSVSGMKSRVQRGRQQLKDLLEQCCAIELDGRQRVIGCEPRDGSGCEPSPLKDTSRADTSPRCRC